MTNKPKYTVLIPTRNGEAYVISALKSVIDQPYDSVEVIVSVNHSQDDTLNKLAVFADDRVSIISPPKLLSMAKHYEWCLQHASGEWVTILGDDDAVMPYFFDEVDALLNRWSNHAIDAVSFKRAHYLWPGCNYNTVVSFSARRHEKLIAGSRLISSAIAGGAAHYDLPQIYTNNIVRGEFIKRLTTESGGNFYHELTPDVYSGTVVALNAKKILRSEVPVFWTGTSPKSVGIAIAIENGEEQFPENSKLKNLENRGKEHFRLAERDGLGVASEIGVDVWNASMSSSTYVLSALLKYPNLGSDWKRFIRFFLYLGFADATYQILIKGDKVKKRENSRAIRLQILSLKMNRYLVNLSLPIVLLSRAISFTKRAIDAMYRLFPSTHRVFYLSKSHEEVPNILDASKEVQKLMKKTEI